MRGMFLIFWASIPWRNTRYATSTELSDGGMRERGFLDANAWVTDRISP